jgi:hypothetical protein
MKRRWVVSSIAFLLLASPARPSPPEPGPPPAGQPAKPTPAPAASARSHTETSGCLEKHPEPSRREIEPTRTTGEGIVVQHNLEHACCVTSQVATTVTGQDVEVVETLSGKRCRCLCTSTLRTSIPVSPGTYRLTVWLDDHGTRTRITAPDLRVVVTAGKSYLVSLGEKSHAAKRVPSDAVQDSDF